MTILASSGEVMTSDEIAGVIGTNPAVVRRLAQALYKAGFVQSKLGPGGGLKLGKPAQQITLACVFAVTKEAPLLQNIPHDKCSCAVAEALEQTISTATEQAEAAFFKALSQQTLQDVLDQAVRVTTRDSSGNRVPAAL